MKQILKNHFVKAGILLYSCFVSGSGCGQALKTQDNSPQDFVCFAALWETVLEL